MRSKSKHLLSFALVIIMMTCALLPSVYADPSSKSIDLTAKVLEPKPEIGIELNATALNFGDLYPGETSNIQYLKVSNVGLKDIDVAATVSDTCPEALFVPGLSINNAAWGEYGAILASDRSDDTQIMLQVPDDYTSRGQASGEATFWATAHSYVPEADFSATPLSGNVPLTVQFTDLSSNSPTTWAWDFGDGASSNLQNPSHEYSSAGSFTVSLTVTNSDGTDTETKTAYVTSSTVVMAPVAGFSADVTSGGAPLTVTFSDASTNSPTSWAWDFDNDGTTDSTDQNPSHTYVATGTYTVSLTVTNSAGSDSEVKSAYIAVNNAATNMDWVTFQGNNHHTGVTSEQAAIESATLAWSAQTTSTGMAGFDVAPIVADGAVFEISQKGSVIAYSIDTGAKLWERADLIISSGMGFQLSTPAYNDHVLYAAVILGTKQGFGVFALDASDGHTIWSKQFLAGWNVQPNTPIVYDEGKIYLGCWFSNSTAGHYYCLDATSGTTLWDRVASTGKSYYWAGAAVIGDYLVFGEDSGKVISVNKDTGVTMQEISAATTLGLPDPTSTSQIIRSTMVYSEASGMVFFTIQSGYCCAIGFNTATGTFDSSKKWATSIGYSTSTPAVYGGKVYVGAGTFSGSSNYLYCLDETTGVQQWQLSVNGGVQSSPVVSTHYDDGDGEVYIYFTTNAGNGRAYCVDANGNVKWYYEPPTGQTQYVLQGVSICDGKLFFGNDKGYLFALGGE